MEFLLKFILPTLALLLIAQFIDLYRHILVQQFSFRFSCTKFMKYLKDAIYFPKPVLNIPDFDFFILKFSSNSEFASSFLAGFLIRQLLVKIAHFKKELYRISIILKRILNLYLINVAGQLSAFLLFSRPFSFCLEMFHSSAACFLSHSS